MAGKWLAGRVFERVLVPLIASVIGGGASWLWYWEMREAPGTEPTAPGTASPGTEQHDRVAQGKALSQHLPTRYTGPSHYGSWDDWLESAVEVPLQHDGGRNEGLAIATEAKPRLAILTPLAALPGFEAFPWRLARGMTRDEAFDASDRVASLRDNGDLSIPADFEVFGLKIHRMEVGFSPFDSLFSFVELNGRSTLTPDEVPAHRRRGFAAFKQAFGLPFDERVDMIAARLAGYRVFLDYAVDEDASGSGGITGEIGLGPAGDVATTYHHRITVENDPAVACIAVLGRC